MKLRENFPETTKSIRRLKRAYHDFWRVHHAIKLTEHTKKWAHLGDKTDARDMIGAELRRRTQTTERPG